MLEELCDAAFSLLAVTSLSFLFFFNFLILMKLDGRQYTCICFPV